MRRRASVFSSWVQLAGNTSACAEKRYDFNPGIYRHWKYLRVCGEERIRWSCSSVMMEIPPRVRRRVRCRPAPIQSLGNTSACAEKRLQQKQYPTEGRKYLRVCGEEVPGEDVRHLPQEIPPRVRRRDRPAVNLTLKGGNTSACAEKRGS